MRRLPHRRLHESRLRIEALEPRTLMAVAGSPDPGFGGAGFGYSTVSLGLAVNSPSAPVVLGLKNLPGVQVVPGLNGQAVVTGTTSSLIGLGVTTTTIAIARFNANGTPDPTFGAGGEVQLPGAGALSAVQPDGKIIVVTEVIVPGTENSTFAAVRLNVNGTLDTSFGTNGLAQYPASTTTPVGQRVDQVESILIQSDNKIVLVSSASDPNATNFPTVFAAVRLNADGSLDTSYGQGGTADIPVQANPKYAFTSDSVVAAVILPGDQIALVGNVATGIAIGFGQTGTGLFDIAVLRINASGSLDPTFDGGSSGGVLLLPADPNDPNAQGANKAEGIALQPNDQVVISGFDKVLLTGTGQFGQTLPAYGNSLYRINANGTLDTTFGTQGRAKPNVNGAVAVQADGSIVLAGQGLVQRVTSNGSPDATFGNSTLSGVVSLRPLSPTLAASVAIDSISGDILIPSTQSIPTLSGRRLGLSLVGLLPATTTAPAAKPPTPIPPGSLDGLRQTNISVYDPTSGTLYDRPVTTFLGLEGGDLADQFGFAGVGQSIPALADYQGTGADQVAVYLPATGTYAIQSVSGSTTGLLMAFGIPGAGQTIPVPADYEGTGKADIAVYLTSLADFAIIPSNGTAPKLVRFGISGAGQSIPAPADYYATGQSDIAVYLASIGAFAVQDPTGKTSGEIVPFGKPGLGQSIPVPGDYDGSGQTEFAVYVPSLGAYFYRSAITGKDVEVPFGTPNSGEIPVPGDYDGSGRTEVAVYDPTRGFNAYRSVVTSKDVITYFGTPNNGSLPAAAAAGDLPEFTTPGSGHGLAIRSVSASAPLVASSSGSTNSVTLTRSSATPTGPSPASIRILRTLVNQAAPDPSRRI